MRKLTMTLTAAVLMLGTMAVAAEAQSQGAASLHAQIKNATSIHQAACGGFGPYCPPGFVRACGPYRCWCRPC